MKNEMRKWIDIVENAGNEFSHKDFLNTIEDYVENYSDKPGKPSVHIQQVFDAMMPEMNGSHALYRGSGVKSWNEVNPHEDFRKQDTITFDGYLSTTDDVNIAMNFIEKCIDDRDNAVVFLFSIQTKPGCRGIDVNSWLFPDGMHHSISDDDLPDPDDPDYDSKFDELMDHHNEIGYSHEHEVILNRGSSFHVVSRESKNVNGIEYWEVKLEQIK